MRGNALQMPCFGIFDLLASYTDYHSLFVGCLLRRGLSGNIATIGLLQAVNAQRPQPFSTSMSSLNAQQARKMLEDTESSNVSYFMSKETSRGICIISTIEGTLLSRIEALYFSVVKMQSQEITSADFLYRLQ